MSDLVDSLAEELFEAHQKWLRSLSGLEGTERWYEIPRERQRVYVRMAGELLPKDQLATPRAYSTSPATHKPRD